MATLYNKYVSYHVTWGTCRAAIGNVQPFYQMAAFFISECGLFVSKGGYLSHFIICVGREWIMRRYSYCVFTAHVIKHTHQNFAYIVWLFNALINLMSTWLDIRHYLTIGTSGQQWKLLHTYLGLVRPQHRQSCANTTFYSKRLHTQAVGRTRNISYTVFRKIVTVQAWKLH